MTRVNFVCCFCLDCFWLFLTVSAASDWLRADDENVSLLQSVFIMTYIKCYSQFSIISHGAIDPCTVFVLMNALTAQRDSSYHCNLLRTDKAVVCVVMIVVVLSECVFPPFLFILLPSVWWDEEIINRFMRKRQAIAWETHTHKRTHARTHTHTHKHTRDCSEQDITVSSLCSDFAGLSFFFFNTTL